MRWFQRNGIGACVMLVFVVGAAAQAASPYDAYYDDYQTPEQPVATPYLSDNDAYYTVPQQAVRPPAYPTDNDAYYSPPGSYDAEYPAAAGRSHCNTIGDMPSCGGD